MNNWPNRRDYVYFGVLVLVTMATATFLTSQVAESQIASNYQDGTVLGARVTAAAVTATCGGSYPQAATTTATTGIFKAIAIGVDSASNMVFPTWTDAGGQDDIIWYPGIHDAGGDWHADIDLANHKGLGTINVHIYMNYPQAPVFCGTASFSRVGQALTVTKAGTGSGTVTSGDGKINCGSTCSASFVTYDSITLTATAAAGSTFAGWSGDCPGNCIFNGSKTAIATFNTAPAPAPTAYITINNTHSPSTPIIVPPNSPQPILRWITSNVTSCDYITVNNIPTPYNQTVSSGLGGADAGVATGVFTGTNTYKITCTGPGGTVSDQVVVTVQAAVDCAYTVSPFILSAEATAATKSVAVTTTSACAWTAVTNADWITVTSGGSGTGNGTVNLSFVANGSTTARNGTLTIARQTVTVTQVGAAAAVCTYTVSPTTVPVSSDAYTSAPITVTPSASTCAWTATSNATWLTITTGASGTGNGTAFYSIAANTGVARTGTMTIAGQTVTVSQQAGAVASCTTATFQVNTNNQQAAYYLIYPDGTTHGWNSTRNFPSMPLGPYSITIDTVSGFTKLATPASFTLACGTVAPTVTITYTPSSTTCTYTVSPASIPVSSDAYTSAPITVTSSASTCAWTATSNATWLTITTGASGTGNGTVLYSIAANTGVARTGTMTIAGQTVTVSQRVSVATNLTPVGYLDVLTSNDTVINGWAYDPNHLDLPVSVLFYFDGPTGQGTNAFGTTANVDRPDVNTYFNAKGINLTGRHGFSVPVPSNLLTGRHTVYAYAVDLDDATGASNRGLDASPRAFGVAVTTTPTPIVFSVNSPSSDGVSLDIGFQFSWTATGAPSRSLVSAQIYKDGSYLTDIAYNLPTTSGLFWNPLSSNSTWRPGTGYQLVLFLTLDGTTLSTARSNSFTLKAPTSTPTSDTQAPTVPTNLTATAVSATQINLSWTAATDNIGVTGYRILRNGAEINRVAAVVTYQDASLTPSTSYSYTVSALDAANNQSAQSVAASATTQPASGCTFAVSPTTVSAPATGIAGNVTVTTASGCAWTATSNATWVTITSGASGTGNATVAYTVAVNAMTTSRTGTLVIAGQTVTITQAGNTSTTPLSITTASLLPNAQVGINYSTTLTATGSALPYGWNVTAGSLPPGFVLSNQQTDERTVIGGMATTAGTYTFTVTVNAGFTGGATSPIATASKQFTLTVTAPSVPSGQNLLPIGNLEEVTSDYFVKGWAFDPNHLSETLAIHVYFDGPTSGTAVLGSTDQLRDDVNTWLRQDYDSISGNHGFKISVPEKYRDGNRHSVYVYAIDLDDVSKHTALLRSNSPEPVTFPDCVHTVTPTAVSSGASGSTGTLTVTAVTGDCPVTQASNQNWITFVGQPQVRFGTGTVTYTIARNSSVSVRSANMTVGGKIVTVLQQGAGNSLTTGTGLTEARHARGAVVLDHDTVYFIGADLRYPFPSEAIFLSWGHKWSEVEPATAGDLAMPIGPPVEFK